MKREHLGMEAREGKGLPGRIVFIRLRALLGLLLGLISQPAFSQESVVVTWTPDTDGATGYRVYSGTASGEYSQAVDAAGQSQLIVSNLTPGVVNYFTVAGYGPDGVESPFSNEIGYLVYPTELPLVTLTAPEDGTSLLGSTSVLISANVAAKGHTINKVQFLNLGLIIGESAQAPYSFNWTIPEGANLSLNAQIIYDGGMVATSLVARVSVLEGRPSAGATTFAGSSGEISGPFIVSGEVIYQNATTGVTEGGRAVYSFSVPRKDGYIISAKVNAEGRATHSFYVNVDGEPEDPGMVWEIPVTSGFETRKITWVGEGSLAAKVFSLPAGTHKLVVVGREPGTQLSEIAISPADELPLPWVATDIGKPSVSGVANVDTNLFILAGTGSINGTADSARFAYRMLSGDGEVSAQVLFDQNISPAGRAGVMIRDNLSPGSRYAFVGINPKGDYYFQRRNHPSSPSTLGSPRARKPSPRWVRLVRARGSLNGYTSSDGVKWSLLGSIRISLGSTVYCGLVDAAGDLSKPATAIFRNVTAKP